MLPHHDPVHSVRAMNLRTRKLVGTVILIVFLGVYALIATAFAASRIVDASNTARVIYFLVAGLAWVPPAGLLIRWMQRPE